MSIFKMYDICCDICKKYIECSVGIGPTTYGTSPGSGIRDARRWSKDKGWTQRKWGKVTIDVCPKCKNKPTPKTPWFAKW